MTADLAMEALQAEAGRRLALLRDLPEEMGLDDAADFLNVDVDDLGEAMLRGHLPLASNGRVRTRALLEQLGVRGL